MNVCNERSTVQNVLFVKSADFEHFRVWGEGECISLARGALGRTLLFIGGFAVDIGAGFTNKIKRAACGPAQNVGRRTLSMLEV